MTEAKNQRLSKTAHEVECDSAEPNRDASPAPSNGEDAQGEFGDRNPNWTEKDLSPRDSQERPDASEEAPEAEFGDRNPNWTEKEKRPNKR